MLSQYFNFVNTVTVQILVKITKFLMLPKFLSLVSNLFLLNHLLGYIFLLRISKLTAGKMITKMELKPGTFHT